jgi:hypothetical protein
MNLQSLAHHVLHLLQTTRVKKNLIIRMLIPQVPLSKREK